MELLSQEGIGFLPAIAIQQWNRDSLVFPYFYGGKLVGLRFRDEEGSKSGLEDSLMVPWGIDTLSPYTKSICVVEGESDRLKILTEFHNKELDYCVLGFPGGYFKTEWERDFVNVQNIVVIPDSDDGGDNLIKALKSKFGSKVSVSKLPWQPRQIGKDTCDWFAKTDKETNSIYIQRIDDFIEKTVDLLITNEYSGPLTTDNFLEDNDEHNGELISGYLMEGQIAMIAGRQKMRKTWITLNLVRCLLSPGSSFLGIPSLISSEISPTILYIQTEGSKQKFKERVAKVVKESTFPNKCYWWFKPDLQLDNSKDVDKLCERIKEHGATVLVLDPFQELHGEEENQKATGFWNGLKVVIRKFPKLTIILSHHFGKTGLISEGWEALRGHSSIAGKVDSGLLIEDRPKNENRGSKVRFLFRDEPDLLTPDGKDIFKLSFSDSGLFYLDLNSVVLDKSEDLVNEIMERTQWLYEEALIHYGVSKPTLDAWIKKQAHRIMKTGHNPITISLFGS